MIPPEVLLALANAALPCFVYDGARIRARADLASSLLERCLFPIKACAEPEVVRAAVMAGCGLDLCSEGDAEIADALSCPGDQWKLSSACVSERLLERLAKVGGRLDADSLDQARRWGARGGRLCGLRVAAKSSRPLYGPKFGIPSAEIGKIAERLASEGMRVEGLHLHDHHANLTPVEFADRLTENLETVDRPTLRACRYVNIGGSWPMRHGNPAGVEELRLACSTLRKRLGAFGFHGELQGEPGRWVVGPCGYWAARVGAIKGHPLGDDHRVVVLDTNTPVPCRPSLAPFVVLRDGVPLDMPRRWTCDLYGSANTALDSIGSAVRLPTLAVGDVVVSLGQGAYTRSLIPPFNERERPGAVVIGA